MAATKKHKLNSKSASGVRGGKAAPNKGAPEGAGARICAAALKIAGEKGWGAVTLENVAKEARMPLASVRKCVQTPNDLIPLIVDEMTLEALAEVGKSPGAPHDVLFELMMARFDVLQKHRTGVLAIADEARRDRALAVMLGRAVLRSMSETIDAARLDLPPHLLLSASLAAAYGWAFFIWRGDKTRDMAKTMAALDRALKVIGKGVEIVRRQF